MVQILLGVQFLGRSDGGEVGGGEEPLTPTLFPFAAAARGRDLRRTRMRIGRSAFTTELLFRVWRNTGSHTGCPAGSGR